MRALAELTRSFESIADASATGALDDEHDPEGATVAFERAQVAALRQEARSQVEDLDHALAKLRQGSFGTCEACGQPVPGERLAARPAARTCVGCAGAAPRGLRLGGCGR